MSASQKFMGVVKGLILSYLLTIIMLFITAVVVYKVGISDKVLGILVVVIYIVATFAGGFVTGRKVREKRFLWGMVYGLTYISVALTVSVLFTGSGDREGIAVITKCIMCVAGGMLGIKPLITIQDGKVAMAGKARGLPGAYVTLFKKVEEMGGISSAFPALAGYTVSPREVTPIQTYLRDNLQQEDLLVRQIGCVIGTHAGPGAFGINNALL